MRLSIVKSPNAKQYYVIKDCYDGKKRTSRIVEKLPSFTAGETVTSPNSLTQQSVRDYFLSSYVYFVVYRFVSLWYNKAGFPFSRRAPYVLETDP